MIFEVILLLAILIWRLWKYMYIPLPANAREPWATQKAFATLDTVFDGVSVRIYRPSLTDQNSPALVYIHGGGWVFGSINTYDDVTRGIANEANIVVISVQYRLAPEHVFPAAFDDCFTVTKFILEHATSYGINLSRVGIAGDSAGGQLAMAVCHKLATREYKALPKLRIMGLIYPVLQAFDFNLPSCNQYSGQKEPSLITKYGICMEYDMYAFGSIGNVQDFLENRHTSTEMKTSDVSKLICRDFLPQNKQTHISQPNLQNYNEALASNMSDLILNPYFSPLLVSNEDLQKLPKTYLLTVEYDPLWDEGLILASRLEKLKHNVVHKHFEGLPHGFINFACCSSSREFILEFSNYLLSNL